MPSFIHSLFQRVAGRYDKMNDLMSLGLHHAWKRSFVNKIPFPSSSVSFKILDVAGGTGDIVALILKKQPQTCPLQLIVCDISENMMRKGQEKRLEGIQWTCGDAVNLPFPNNTLDCYTISFGLRNVPAHEQALQEAYRVLKPGGVFLCLEFSHVTSPLLHIAYQAYSSLLPFMGRVVAQNQEAYRYLVESIQNFPSQKIVTCMLKEAGFQKVSVENLSGGIVAIHQAWKEDSKGE